jgi:hypothetical protein
MLLGGVEGILILWRILLQHDFDPLKLMLFQRSVWIEPVIQPHVNPRTVAIGHMLVVDGAVEVIAVGALDPRGYARGIPET